MYSHRHQIFYADSLEMPASKTRKSPKMNLIGDDPLMLKLAEGKVMWGDLLYAPAPSPASATRSNKRHSSPKALSFNAEREYLDDYIVPDLTMRKGIWEHFPVIVNQIGPNLFEIVWHKANLKEWRQSRSASWDEFQEYETYAEFRLIHALRQMPHKYKLLPSKKESQIILFEMVGAVAEPVFKGPKLLRLNDIKAHFPIVWHPAPGRAGETTYAIELRGDFMRKTGQAGTKAMSNELVAALRASPAWHVLPPTAGEVCRIEMRHDK